jgi:hypothetical protein
MHRTHLQHTFRNFATCELENSAHQNILQGTCILHDDRSFETSLQHQLLLQFGHGQNSRPRSIAPWIDKALHPPMVEAQRLCLAQQPCVALPLAGPLPDCDIAMVTGARTVVELLLEGQRLPPHLLLVHHPVQRLRLPIRQLHGTQSARGGATVKATSAASVSAHS